MRQKINPQMSLFTSVTSKPIAKELEQISKVLDACPGLVEIVYEDLVRTVRADTGREGMSAEQVLTLMLARLQRTGGAVLVTARLTTRIADMAMRMQQSGIATRLIWVSDDSRDASMELIERMKMGGVEASRLDPWREGAGETADGGIEDEYDAG